MFSGTLFMFKKTVLYLGTALLALPFYEATAVPFDQNAVTSVSERQALHRSQGGRLGAFILHPSLRFQQVYDDNIFRQGASQLEDTITVIEPSLDIQSDWNLHQINAGVRGSFGRFSEQNNENYDDHNAYIGARFDLDYGTFLSVNLRQVQAHEDRGALDDVDGDHPIQYQVNSLTMRFARELGIVKLRLNAEHRDFTYEDSSRAGAGIDNSIRDRTQDIMTTRLSYGLSDHYELFGQMRYDRRRYDLSSTSYRNSDGYDYRLGAAMNISGKLQGDIYGGYIQQDFAGGFSDINEFNLGGSLLWGLSDLTSLRAELEREVQETTLADSSGYIRTSAGVGLEHAFRDNFMVRADFGVEEDEYEGATSTTRNNRTYTNILGLNYVMYDRINANLDYSYIKRDFEQGNGDYDNHRVALSVQYVY